VDNDPAVVAEGKGRRARLHPEVAALAGHLGLRIVVREVRIRRPGSPRYGGWYRSGRTRSSTFSPDAGPGTYRIKARLRNTVNGATSGFSRVLPVRF
jgi:hypothetical protein